MANDWIHHGARSLVRQLVVYSTGYNSGAFSCLIWVPPDHEPVTRLEQQNSQESREMQSCLLGNCSQRPGQPVQR